MPTIPVVYTQAKCIQTLERNKSKYSTKNRPNTRIMLKSGMDYAILNPNGGKL
jgi:hypothetical protein